MINTCETCSDFLGHFCGCPMNGNPEGEFPWLPVNKDTPACGFYFKPKLPDNVVQLKVPKDRQLEG